MFSFTIINGAWAAFEITAFVVIMAVSAICASRSPRFSSRFKWVLFFLAIAGLWAFRLSVGYP